MTDAPLPVANVAILVLAAGAATRMRGGDKLLEEVDGQPLLRKVVGHACAVSDTVLVCLRPEDSARRTALKGLGCRQIDVLDASEGMAHSLRAGVAQLPSTISAVMVVPADMPEISQDDLSQIAQAHIGAPGAIIRATSQNGRPGHPVLFPARLFEELRALSGDVGAREVLKPHAASVHLIDLPDNHATIDLDTPEDWRAWRAAGQK